MPLAKTALLQGLQAAWHGWKRLAQKIGDFQARLLLTLIYMTVLLPFGLIVRFFGDPLRIKTSPNAWIVRPPEVHDVGWARKQ